jgi:hypothetical protein
MVDRFKSNVKGDGQECPFCTSKVNFKNGTASVRSPTLAQRTRKDGAPSAFLGDRESKSPPLRLRSGQALSLQRTERPERGTRVPSFDLGAGGVKINVRGSGRGRPLYAWGFLSSLTGLVPLLLAYPGLTSLRLRSGQALGCILSPLRGWGGVGSLRGAEALVFHGGIGGRYA